MQDAEVLSDPTGHALQSRRHGLIVHARLFTIEQHALLLLPVLQAYVWRERDPKALFPWLRLLAALLLATVTDACMRMLRAAAHLLLLSYRLPVKRKVSCQPCCCTCCQSAFCLEQHHSDADGAVSMYASSAHKAVIWWHCCGEQSLSIRKIAPAARIHPHVNKVLMRFLLCLTFFMPLHLCCALCVPTCLP